MDIHGWWLPFNTRWKNTFNSFNHWFSSRNIGSKKNFKTDSWHKGEECLETCLISSDRQQEHCTKRHIYFTDRGRADNVEHVDTHASQVMYSIWIVVSLDNCTQITKFNDQSSFGSFSAVSIKRKNFVSPKIRMFRVNIVREFDRKFFKNIPIGTLIASKTTRSSIKLICVQHVLRSGRRQRTDILNKARWYINTYCVFSINNLH